MRKPRAKPSAVLRAGFAAQLGDVCILDYGMSTLHILLVAALEKIGVGKWSVCVERGANGVPSDVPGLPSRHGGPVERGAYSAHGGGHPWAG